MVEEKLEKLKFFGDKYWNLINEKNKTIIISIQILVTLLVIASFDDKIIPFSSLKYLKILITFLLALIPIMLIDYLIQINDGLNSLHKALEFPTEQKRWYMLLINGSNYVYAVILCIVINIIIWLINQDILLAITIASIQLLLLSLIICLRRIGKNN